MRVRVPRFEFLRRAFPFAFCLGVGLSLGLLPVELVAATLTAKPNPCQVPFGQTNCSTTLQWSADVDAQVWVSVDNEPETNVASTNPGTWMDTVNWIQPNHSYLFILYHYSGGFRQGALASVTVTASPLKQLEPQPRPGRCLSSHVPVNRSWEEEQHADINHEFNDYAALFLDAASAECKTIAAKTMADKLAGVLRFAEAGGTVASPMGLNVHPFHNWLWGAAVSHLFAAALELKLNGVALPEDLLARARDAFVKIPVPQDPGCQESNNGCMDDYALTASGFAWVAAYEARSGREAHFYVDRAQSLLGKMFQPMAFGGGVCYQQVGSTSVSCDADPRGLKPGHVRIIGIGHGQENPNYGVGLMKDLHQCFIF